ncbi:serine hydrolase [Pelomonas sp. KK5]|uniref:serine hydrolase domain-containing protein n=1 Tax=Pelomonas sp. KK5 TaxID=1855730 RepID=UPI00130200F8|nr:serine hydrolase domain-containing protein [Pelomonas sp. KK5]
MAEQELTAALDGLFAPFRRADAPGCTVAVARGGRTVYRGAFGMASVEQGVALQAGTPMPVGSISKQFVCAALLLLAHEGALSLEAPIGSLVEGLQGEQASPTLRQLMTHTGGVRCYLDQWVFNGYVTLPAGMAERIQRRQHALNFAPGTGSSYSNGGYLLLSLAIERASGMPLGEFLARRFFEPLSMTGTCLPPHRWPLRTGEAATYLPSPPGWRHGIAISDDLYGDGGLVSTADDLLRWATWLRTSTGPVALSAMALPTRLANGFASDYGLGLITERWRGLRVVQHAGGMPGASSSLFMLPEEDLDVVVAFNRAGPAIGMGLKVIETVLGARLAAAVDGPRTQHHPTLLGRYVAEESGLLFGFADMDGALGLSLFGGAPFAPDAAAPDDGMLPFVADVGTGGMRFRWPEPSRPGGALIEYRDAGTWRPARRLDMDKPDPGSLSPDACHWFHSGDAAARVRLELDGGQPALRFQGEYGGALYPAELLEPELLRFWPTAFPGGMLARLGRRAGVLQAIVVSTSRTRRTVFERGEG